MRSPLTSMGYLLSGDFSARTLKMEAYWSRKSSASTDAKQHETGNTLTKGFRSLPKAQVMAALCDVSLRWNDHCLRILHQCRSDCFRNGLSRLVNVRGKHCLQSSACAELSCNGMQSVELPQAPARKGVHPTIGSDDVHASLLNSNDCWYNPTFDAERCPVCSGRQGACDVGDQIGNFFGLNQPLKQRSRPMFREELGFKFGGACIRIR